jgi:hypothetical protein
MSSRSWLDVHGSLRGGIHPGIDASTRKLSHPLDESDNFFDYTGWQHGMKHSNLFPHNW